MQPFEPVKIDTSVVEEIKRVPLFFIDDREYTIPEKIPPNLVLRYLADVKDEGPEVALSRAVEAILGTEAMDDLADCDQVTDEQMKAIFDILEKLLMGAAEKTVGKSRRARRR